MHRNKLIERNKNNFKDLIGQSFGKLTVIQKTNSLRGHTGWICQCECGNIITTDSGRGIIPTARAAEMNLPPSEKWLGNTS